MFRLLSCLPATSFSSLGAQQKLRLGTGPKKMKVVLESHLVIIALVLQEHAARWPRLCCMSRFTSYLPIHSTPGPRLLWYEMTLFLAYYDFAHAFFSAFLQSQVLYLLIWRMCLDTLIIRLAGCSFWIPFVIHATWLGCDAKNAIIGWLFSNQRFLFFSFF